MSDRRFASGPRQQAGERGQAASTLSSTTRMRSGREAAAHPGAVNSVSPPAARLSALLAGVRAREANDDFAATTRTIAESLHRSTVQPDQVADQRRPRRRCRLENGPGALVLHEEVERALEQVGAHPHALVANPDDRLVVVDRQIDSRFRATGDSEYLVALSIRFPRRLDKRAESAFTSVSRRRAC